MQLFADVGGLHFFFDLVTFWLCSAGRDRSACTVHDRNMCRCNMYSTGVDSGMSCVELKQNSHVEMVSIFTMKGSSHTDFADSVSRISCVGLLLVVFYRYLWVPHMARPLAMLGSTTSRYSIRRSHPHENHIARGKCAYGCACFQACDDFLILQDGRSTTSAAMAQACARWLLARHAVCCCGGPVACGGLRLLLGDAAAADYAARCYCCCAASELPALCAAGTCT